MQQRQSRLKHRPTMRMSSFRIDPSLKQLPDLSVELQEREERLQEELAKFRKRFTENRSHALAARRRTFDSVFAPIPKLTSSTSDQCLDENIREQRDLLNKVKGDMVRQENAQRRGSSVSRPSIDQVEQVTQKQQGKEVRDRAKQHFEALRRESNKRITQAVTKDERDFCFSSTVHHKFHVPRYSLVSIGTRTGVGLPSRSQLSSSDKSQKALAGWKSSRRLLARERPKSAAQAGRQVLFDMHMKARKALRSNNLSPQGENKRRPKTADDVNGKFQKPAELEQKPAKVHQEADGETHQYQKTDEEAQQNQTTDEEAQQNQTVKKQINTQEVNVNEQTIAEPETRKRTRYPGSTLLVGVGEEKVCVESLGTEASSSLELSPTVEDDDVTRNDTMKEKSNENTNQSPKDNTSVNFEEQLRNSMDELQMLLTNDGKGDESLPALEQESVKSSNLSGIEELYGKHCIQQNLVPCSRALELLSRNKLPSGNDGIDVFELVIPFQQLTDHDLEAICWAIPKYLNQRHNKMLSAPEVILQLTGNSITRKGCNTIAKLVGEQIVFDTTMADTKDSNSSNTQDVTPATAAADYRIAQVVYELDLSDNTIGDIGLKQLLRAVVLQGGGKPVSLGFRSTQLTDNSSEVIGDSLSVCGTRLKYLDLSQNRFGWKTAEQIGSNLQFTNCVKLSIGWNRFGDKGGVLLVTGIAQCPTLESVDLSFNSLGDETGKQIAQVLSENRLRNLSLLDISHNHFTGVTGHAIAGCLRVQQYLRELRIGFNTLGLSATKAILQAVVQPSASPVLDALCMENTLDIHTGIEDNIQYLYCLGRSVVQYLKTLTADNPTPKRIHISLEFPPKPRQWTMVDIGIVKEEITVQVVPQMRLEDTVFAPRLNESESQSYYDNKQVLDEAFKHDWHFVKPKLVRFIQMMIKTKEETAVNHELDVVQSAVQEEYLAISNVFRYYSSNSNPSDAIGMNDYIALIKGSNMIDAEEHGSLSFADVQTAFVQANFEATDVSDNPNRALCRYELLEVLVRLAHRKYMQDSSLIRVFSLSDAISKLLGDYFVPNCKRYDSNSFRRDFLYWKDVHLVFYESVEAVKALWAKYAQGDGEMAFVEWQRLMRESSVINNDFTVLEATYAFYLSNMRVTQDIGRKPTRPSPNQPLADNPNALSYVEFLEAIVRIADWHSQSYLGLESNALLSQKVGKVIALMIRNVTENEGRRKRKVFSNFLNLNPQDKDYSHLQEHHEQLLCPADMQVAAVFSSLKNSEIMEFSGSTKR